jgi:hypothetical protein
MLERGLPLDRETYLAMNWGADLPEPWTAEHEEQVPEPLRLKRFRGS